jgi:hypothetical protein
MSTVEASGRKGYSDAMAEIMISHRTADTFMAENLAKEIEQAGHVVRLDSSELNVGDSITEWMNSAVSNVQYVVLCYSVHGVESPWIIREWASTLARQLQGKGVRILPVILTGGDAPALLADIKTADLTRDWARGIGELLRAIK